MKTGLACLASLLSLAAVAAAIRDKAACEHKPQGGTP